MGVRLTGDSQNKHMAHSRGAQFGKLPLSLLDLHLHLNMLCPCLSGVSRDAAPLACMLLVRLSAVLHS
jgi:hypothetical protein